MIINIRGTNGSGKTTLAQQLIGPYAQQVTLNSYAAPTKRDPERRKWVEGWGCPGGFLAIGSYRTGCGGMDTIPSFEIQQTAVAMAASTHKRVVAEGVLASTVAGSWLEFFRGYQNQEVIIAYMDTPLELCLERIKARQIASTGEAREIKVDQVRDKVRAINATRAKFDAAGIRTITLRHDRAQSDLMEALRD